MDEYLMEAVESVVNQNIGFKENIQLICINSIDIDDDENLIEPYRRKYPKNITYLTCDSDNTFDAYNLGLEYATGGYVNFMASNDVLSKDLIKKVDNSINKHSKNVVSVSTERLDEKRYPLKFKFADDTEDVVNLKKEPNFIQLDVNSVFIKRDFIGDLKFDNHMDMADALFMAKLLLNNDQYSVVKNATYYLREPYRSNDEFITKEKIQNSFTYFYRELMDYSMDKYDAVPKFIQNTFLYFLQFIIKIEDIDEFFNHDEIDGFWDNMTEILSHIGTDQISKNKLIANGIKNFLIYIKNGDFHIETKGSEVYVKSGNDVLNVLHKRKIWFDIVEIKNGFLNISGSLTSSCDKRYISIEAVKSGNDIKSVFEAIEVEYPNTTRVTKRFLSIPWEFTYSFDFKIPIGKKESFSLFFRTIYQEGDKRAVIYNEVVCRFYVNLSEFGNYFRKDNNILLLKRDVFYLRPESYLRAIFYEIKTMIKLFVSSLPMNAKVKTILFRLLLFVLYPFYKNRKIWLFTDRRQLSGDNGEHFFRYAITRKDDAHKYFVIEDNCEDYTRLKEAYGKHVVEFGSAKHKILYAFAKKLMQSQISPSTYNPFHEGRPRRFAGWGLGDVYFLQHGVSKYDMSSWVTKYDKPLSLILTVSDLDYNEFTSDHYNYDKEIVQELGYPRFDNLTNENLKRQIVIMPTWRNNIKNANQLLKSEYYERFNNLLNNEKLIEHAKRTGYDIILKPHPLMYKFINVFNVNEYVKVDNVTKHHDILCDSALMVTDYSSVAVDFVYLKKPVIYYQYGAGSDHHFDINSVITTDDSMEFGEIVQDEDRLIEKIIEYMDNDCRMEEEYQRRVDNFFKYTDRNNSKRAYDWIYEH